MKQMDIFGFEIGGESKSKKPETYTSKIKTPVYEPKNRKPNVLELCNNSKTRRLESEILASNLPDSEKAFLIRAAARHTVFNYERIADYYAHSEKEMQGLMEKSALVVIDFNKAYELGYVRLAYDTANNYFEDYREDGK